MNKKPSTFISFVRYVISSMIATGGDFAVLILFTEVFNLWYVFSATLGAISGGVIGFLLGRNWAFMSKEGKRSTQAVKYAWVWVGSIILNVGLLYVFVEYFDIQYIFSKAIVTILVGIGFNYLLQRNFIFKNVEARID